jgi:general stress protein 26
MAFTYKNKRGQDYFLHKREVTLRGSGKKQTIYFFARKEDTGAINEVPEGYMVKEVERTGLPILKKK